MAFYDAMTGDHWTSNQGWTRDNVDLDEWHGVKTDPSGRVVLELVLEENELFGTLPPELGDLANLQKLDLSGNQLQGEIPPELGNLSSLVDLDLGQNQLRGEIPWELGDLIFLEVLVLAANRLDGEIPPVLGDLTRLRTLDLRQNQLRGEIPPELGNLSALETLFLQENQLEGGIPPELGDLRSLTTIDLSGNAAMNGCMPEELGVAFCTAPRNVVVTHEEGFNTLNWEDVEGASHYVIWWDDFFDCRSDRSFGCEQIGGEIFETTFTHEVRSPDAASYAIAACTRSGCGEWASTLD